jgi:hypothetical protein
MFRVTFRSTSVKSYQKSHIQFHSAFYVQQSAQHQARTATNRNEEARRPIRSHEHVREQLEPGIIAKHDEPAGALAVPPGPHLGQPGVLRGQRTRRVRLGEVEDGVDKGRDRPRRHGLDSRHRHRRRRRVRREGDRLSAADQSVRGFHLQQLPDAVKSLSAGPRWAGYFPLTALTHPHRIEDLLLRKREPRPAGEDKVAAQRIDDHEDQLVELRGGGLAMLGIIRMRRQPRHKRLVRKEARGEDQHGKRDCQVGGDQEARHGCRIIDRCRTRTIGERDFQGMSTSSEAAAIGQRRDGFCTSEN